MGPCDLDELMSRLTPARHPDLLVGTEHGADAGVYRISPELALVQSVDFFPPNLSDARAFGRVTAANALSDLYTVGARPLTALNLLATPKEEGRDALVAMMQGAQEKVEEAGAVICGGHTILSPSVIYGLAVTGVVNPARMLRHNTPQAGDALVLTKPLGTGIVIHAVNAGQATSDELATCVAQMATLNRLAAELMLEHGAHAATDITGFGLLGHLGDMLSLGGTGALLHWPQVPLLERAPELALAGNYPGGSRRNIEFSARFAEYVDCPPEIPLLLNDAQTSGGLLIAIPPAGAAALVAGLTAAGYPLRAAQIGEVTAEHAGKIRVLCR